MVYVIFSLIVAMMGNMLTIILVNDEVLRIINIIITVCVLPIGLGNAISIYSKYKDKL